jgi:hypothetical protein
MCGHEHEHGRRGHHRGPGFRGLGRRGFPSRDEWLGRLQHHEQRLESDLQNVRELIGLLGRGEAPAQPEGGEI